MELRNWLMMKWNFLLGNECWQMSSCIHNAYVSLLEILERNINRIIWVSDVTTFGGWLALNVSGQTATVELLCLLSFPHDPPHLLGHILSLSTIRILTSEGLARKLWWGFSTGIMSWNIKYHHVRAYCRWWEKLLVLVWVIQFYFREICFCIDDAVVQGVIEFNIFFRILFFHFLNVFIDSANWLCSKTCAMVVSSLRWEARFCKTEAWFLLQVWHGVTLDFLCCIQVNSMVFRT